MRTYISLAVIAFAVAAAGYLYFATASEEVLAPAASGNAVVGSMATSSDAYDVLVTFDGERFSPAELTIKKGQRVRFENASDTEMWPASAIHPTHSIYPEKSDGDCLGSSFDACRRLVAGEFFAFTFNEVGEWRYHDHIRAYKTGIITVTE